MPQTQLLLDFDDTRDPMKMRMLEALRPVCIHYPRQWNHCRRQTCHCTEHVNAVLRVLDTFQLMNRECDPSIEALAMRAGVSVRTMQRRLRLAEELGYVSTISRDRSTSIYSINWLRIWNDTQESEDEPLMQSSTVAVGAV